MKTLKIAILVLVMGTLLAGTSFAQRIELADTSYLDRAQKYLVWGKEVIDQMNQQLELARKDQNMMQIECIEKRLVDIQKLITEIQAGYRNMKGFSLKKNLNSLRQEFTVVDQKRMIAEQLVRLVNICLGKTFHDGFTETVEEFFGYFEEDDPTAFDWDNYWPNPLPPVYEARPASLAENE
jgi:hypothetical protein